MKGKNKKNHIVITDKDIEEYHDYMKTDEGLDEHLRFVEILNKAKLTPEKEEIFKRQNYNSRKRFLLMFIVSIVFVTIGFSYDYFIESDLNKTSNPKDVFYILTWITLFLLPFLFLLARPKKTNF